MTEQEQKAINEYKLTEAAFDAANERLEIVFRLGYEPLLEAGKFDEALEYIRQMPESVAKMYAVDALRVARGDFKK
jgi:thioredoxin-like negative regulator of GroEL